MPRPASLTIFFQLSCIYCQVFRAKNFTLEKYLPKLGTIDNFSKKRQGIRRSTLSVIVCRQNEGSGVVGTSLSTSSLIPIMSYYLLGKSVKFSTYRCPCRCPEVVTYKNTAQSYTVLSTSVQMCTVNIILFKNLKACKKKKIPDDTCSLILFKSFFLYILLIFCLACIYSEP